MTKMHFSAAARAFAFTKPEHPGQALNQWEKDVEMIASVFKQFNNRFDRERFLRACGWEGIGAKMHRIFGV